MIVLIRKEEASAAPAPKPLPDQTSQCRLLALPPELRNHIWSYLLVQDNSPEPHHISSSSTKSYPDMPSISTPRRPSHPSSSTRKPSLPGSSPRINATILRTCRQIHTETQPILYGSNTFDAHSSLLTSLPALNLLTHPSRLTAPPVTSPRVAKLIRRFFLHVRLDTDPRFTRTQVASAFTGVAELEVEVFQSSYGTCDFGVLALFEDVRDVGFAIVRGSVGDGRYAGFLERVMMSEAGTAWPRYHERFVGGDRGWDAWTHGNR